MKWEGVGGFGGVAATHRVDALAVNLILTSSFERGGFVASWSIAEWYGRDIRSMSSEQRREAAQTALAAKEHGVADVEQPLCPFLSNVLPDARCNKLGGVCSIRPYESSTPVKLPDVQPASVCPNRFLESHDGKSIFAVLAEKLYGVTSRAMVAKEIPFLNKVDAQGGVRGAKAGRIDWVLIPDPPSEGDNSKLDWMAIETQAVYFSGANMWDDIQQYFDEPHRLHAPTGQRRPDYRSSGAKRLAPQLDAKSPVMRRWGHKVAVVVDESFFAELSELPATIDDFDNAEVVWVVMRYTDSLNLVIDRILFAELSESVQALQATRPMNRADFEMGLKQELWAANSEKVYEA